MRPQINITNKKRIIFSQKYKQDGYVYGVLTMEPLTEEEQASWKKLGYAFASVTQKDITATHDGKKAEYEITFTGKMSENIAAITKGATFVMQVYTDDIAGYEKTLGIDIPVT